MALVTAASCCVAGPVGCKREALIEGMPASSPQFLQLSVGLHFLWLVHSMNNGIMSSFQSPPRAISPAVPSSWIALAHSGSLNPLSN